MAQKRFIGVMIIGGLLTFIGGLTSFILFLEAIESVRLFGSESVGLSSLESLQGFVLYATLPVLMYTTGVGLLSARPWAHRLVTQWIPAAWFLYFFHMACLIVRSQFDMERAGLGELLSSHPEVFLRVFWRYALLVGGMVFYFYRPLIRQHFEEAREAVRI